MGLPRGHDGSLREASAELGMPFLLYEAGEALRFDEVSIRAGERGIRNVMRELDMLPVKRKPRKQVKPVIARSSNWVRASISGVFRATTPLGAHVDKKTVLGIISDPFGEKEWEVHSIVEGIIIGKNNLPLVNEGEALFHIARFKGIADVAGKIEEFHDDYQAEFGDNQDVDSPVI